MTTAIYPGSFDPITNGHIDVLNRAARLFDKVIIAVLTNPSKKGFLDYETKLNLIRESVKDISNVEVDSFNGLIVEYAKKKNAQVLVRGLRAVTDFEYEMQMAQMNKNLSPEMETLFLVSNTENTFLSSSIVKEVSMLGGDISKLVPESVNNYFNNLNREI